MTPWNFERRHPEFEFPNTDFLWTFAHSEKPWKGHRAESGLGFCLQEAVRL